MSGSSEGKIKLGKANVFLHIKGKSRATVTHIDIELDKLNEIIKPGESTFILEFAICELKCVSHTEYF